MLLAVVVVEVVEIAEGLGADALESIREAGLTGVKRTMGAMRAQLYCGSSNLSLSGKTEHDGKSAEEFGSLH
jgi:hypothetical protein